MDVPESSPIDNAPSQAVADPLGDYDTESVAPPSIGPRENSLTLAAPGRTRRGTVIGELIFIGHTTRLLASLGLEILYNLLSTLIFLAFRKSSRERMRRIILLGPGGGGMTALLLSALLAGLCLPGCSPPKERTMISESQTFRGQINQLKWSIDTLADQSDSLESLEQDLQELKSDSSWEEGMGYSLEHLFKSEDAQESLEEDLHTLSEDDYRQNGIWETFDLWGW